MRTKGFNEYESEIETIKAELEAMGCKSLPTAEQKKLAKLAKDGDVHARMQLVNSVRPYMFDEAKKLADSFHSGEVYMIYNVGVLYAWESVFNFEHTDNTTTNFLSFIKRVARLRMLDEIAGSHSFAQKTLWAKDEVEVISYDQDGYPVYTKEKKLISDIVKVTSYSTSSYVSEDGEDFHDMKLIDTSGSVEDQYIAEESKGIIGHLFNTILTPLQQQAVTASINKKKSKDEEVEDDISLKELAKVYGMTHEGMRQISIKAKDLLKEKFLEYQGDF
jgi:DNA-directed RNA polymerase sigma subunit (sigma70/sigma32)